MGGFNRGVSRGRRLQGVAVFVSAAAALFTLASSAQAQQRQPTAPLVPVVTPLKGDDASAAGGGPSPTAAFAPLRLSLTSGIFPQAGAFPNCDSSRLNASGNLVNGFTPQYYSFLRVTPRLVLHGFSTGGCAVDAGMGSGITYAVPLRKSLWLVPSAGFYMLPSSVGGGVAARVTAAARVDLVKQLGWGGTLNFGLGSRFDSGAFHALHFGGSF